MKRPGLPDLDALSAAEKDQLIVSLWETVLALEGDGGARDRAATAAPDGASIEDKASALRQRIRETAPSRRAQADRPDAGHWLSQLLDYRPLQIIVLLIGLGFLADFAIGWYQRHAAAARQEAARRLANAAFGGLFVEMVRAAYEPDGTTYRATLRMQNASPDTPLYVMQNPPRVFVQAGLTWQEVSSRPLAGRSWGVVKLEGDHEYSVLFNADLKDWSELIPGYMHVQIQSDMLISQNSSPADDIVERNNRFYFYLKPRGADDAEIRRRSNFRGDPPLFIPMPPH